ncbi:hypothetical protein ACIPLR_11375 [Herbaspirillum huttiense]|uniref:hypothetical protein n=1 Tax=Herbaspirillum huttiense TaxID=863372 RepID=UPI002049D1E9|nr:MAG TPA: hypothetical protein [Caudoviricetes sp.]
MLSALGIELGVSLGRDCMTLEGSANPESWGMAIRRTVSGAIVIPVQHVEYTLPDTNLALRELVRDSVKTQKGIEQITPAFCQGC